MEFGLGNGRFVTESPYRDADYRLTLTTDPSVYGRRPLLIYLWDCRLEPDGNLHPPAHVALDCHLAVARVGPTGSVDPADTAARLARLLADTGLPSEDRLKSAFHRRFPPRVLRLELPFPHPMMTDRNRVHVVGWANYVDLLISTAGPDAPRYVLSVPFELQVELLVTGHCGPDKPPFPDRLGTGKRYAKSGFTDRNPFFPPGGKPGSVQEVIYTGRGFRLAEMEADELGLMVFDESCSLARERQRRACRSRLKES